MNVLDSFRGELYDLDGYRARDHQVRDVEADAGLRANEQPLDLFRTLDRAAEPGLHRHLELVSRADMLHGSDEMEEVSPLRVRQRVGANRAGAPLGDRGEDQRGRAYRRKPLRVTVDMGELRSAGLVVMEDRVHLAGDDLQAVVPEQRPGLVASVRQESGRAGRDRALSDGGGLRQDAPDVDLVAPVGR